MKFGTIGCACAAAAVFALLGQSTIAQASSHREAPFITKSPKVDGTDFYMFNSYDPLRSGFVTLIANYQPLQDPIGGPNYFTMDPEALYEIHIDNSADGVEDITFQFRFQNALANAGAGVALPIGTPPVNVGIPLVIAGPVNGTDPFLGAGSVNNINVNETYTVNVVRGGRRTGTSAAVTNAAGSGATFTKPLDNIGKKAFQGGYAAYADQFKYDVNIPGCATPARMFVGQRAESFAVNLGTIFDLIDAPLAVIANPANRNAVPNPLAGKNITSLALEVPVACLRTGATGTAAMIGGWTTASVRQARAINPQSTYATPAREGGAWAQVSRLGMPLVNELVVGLADKDRWNSSEPKDDTQFLKYVTNPTLPKLIELIYGAANAPAPNVFPRADLVAVFLTGYKDAGINVNANGSTAEYLRLNTALGSTLAAAQNNLGAAGCFTAATASTRPVVDASAANTACDPAGFPNGRRPGDDVVDIALRVVMGRLLTTTEAPAGPVPLHDAVLQDQSQFNATFPYLKTPTGGS
jgi:hypothetical protein